MNKIIMQYRILILYSIIGIETHLYKRKLVWLLHGGFKSYLKDTSSCLTFS